jgi:hypothetical protein
MPVGVTACMNRRQFIAACSATGAAAVAGCIDSVPGLGDDGADTDSPEGVVESYINLQDGFFENPEESVESLRGLYHSQSPMIQSLEENSPGQGMSNSDVEFEQSIAGIDGINTVSRGLSAGGILSASPSTQGRQFQLSEDVATELATGETALVDAAYTIETTFKPPEQDEPQSTEIETKERFLVARENEEWQIVFQKSMRGANNR